MLHINILRLSSTIFFFFPDFFSTFPVSKSNRKTWLGDIPRPDWKKFESSKFIADFNQINWEQMLYNENNEVNLSMNEENLTKKNWNFSPNRGLHKVYKTLLKRKTRSTQSLWSLKTKSCKNFITTVTKTVKILIINTP